MSETQEIDIKTSDSAPKPATSTEVGTPRQESGFTQVSERLIGRRRNSRVLTRRR